MALLEWSRRDLHVQPLAAPLALQPLSGRVQVAEPVDPPGERRPPPVLDDHRGVLPASWSHQRPDHYNGSEELFIGIITGFIIIDIT